MDKIKKPKAIKRNDIFKRVFLSIVYIHVIFIIHERQPCQSYKLVAEITKTFIRRILDLTFSERGRTQLLDNFLHLEITLICVSDCLVDWLYIV